MKESRRTAGAGAPSAAGLSELATAASVGVDGGAAGSASGWFASSIAAMDTSPGAATEGSSYAPPRSRKGMTPSSAPTVLRRPARCWSSRMRDFSIDSSMASWRCRSVRLVLVLSMRPRPCSTLSMRVLVRSSRVRPCSTASSRALVRPSRSLAVARLWLAWARPLLASSMANCTHTSWLFADCSPSRISITMQPGRTHIARPRQIKTRRYLIPRVYRSESPGELPGWRDDWRSRWAGRARAHDALAKAVLMWARSSSGVYGLARNNTSSAPLVDSSP
ncbi:MAG: hypothetical protein GIKADHBN_01057 [Phycisphaerales bacterium]|nr:hypothetical protein [Phycisphaerales bacterium]